VAGKGLRRRKSKGRSRLKERKAEKLNAETQSSQRSRKEGMEAGVDRGLRLGGNIEDDSRKMGYCQVRVIHIQYIIRMAGVDSNGVREVLRGEGVGRGVMGLLRLWKCVEKSRKESE
jgi:hypothetical protein